MRGPYPIYRLDFRRSLEYSLHVSSGKSAESFLEQHLVIEPISFLVKLEFKNAFFLGRRKNRKKKSSYQGENQQQTQPREDSQHINII